MKNEMIPGAELEKEGERLVKIPKEWISLRSKMKHSWDRAEIPTEDPRIKIFTIKQFIYISREDVLDSMGDGGYEFPIQVMRLELSEDGLAVKNVVEDHEILAADTLGLLKEVPMFRELIARFELSVERMPEDDLLALQGEKNIKIKEMSVAREWFAARAAEAPTRRFLALWDIQSKSKDVWQGTVDFLKKGESVEYLMTLGAEPCVVVGGSNLQAGEHGLTHIDALSDGGGLVRSLVRRVGKEAQYFVLGGDGSTLPQLLEIKKEIERLGINVVTWDCLNEVKRVAINGETGEWFDLITYASDEFND